MMTKLFQLVVVAVAWLALVTTTTVSALGQSNIFGVFRKRRRSLEEIQDKRVRMAFRKGFVGPHGELLTVKEFEALQAKGANK